MISHLLARERGNALMRCVTIGECMVEMAPTGTAGTYALGFAGDTFNTAWYLASQRPGWDVRYLTAVGDDAVSDRFLAFAAEAGIATEGIRRVAGRTLGLYLIQVEKGERTFSYWRGDSAARLLAEDPDHLRTALDDVDVAIFSGITLAILSEAARGRLLAAIRTARERGVTIVFDPNLRPVLWPGEQAMRDGVMAGAAVADVVIPSLDEEMRHFGDASASDTCARYVAAGAGQVIVKNGPGSVHYRDRGQDGVVDLPQVVEPVDTTAAGDSFNAACVAGLAEGSPLHEAIAAGAALAARVVQGRGALVAT